VRGQSYIFSNNTIENLLLKEKTENKSKEHKGGNIFENRKGHTRRAIQDQKEVR
jgi:hypothetical protein